jgi:hypothetical protein
MVKYILNLLEKIPYRTSFGLSISDKLKVMYYQYIGQHNDSCLCGGIVRTIYHRIGNDVGWETSCDECQFIADED